MHCSVRVALVLLFAMNKDIYTYLRFALRILVTNVPDSI